MQFKSNAENSYWSFLHYFRPALSGNLSILSVTKIPNVFVAYYTGLTVIALSRIV